MHGVYNRDHPYKTSACLRGGGGVPFADARGPGVLGFRGRATSSFEGGRGHFAGMPMVANGRRV